MVISVGQREIIRIGRVEALLSEMAILSSLE